MEELFKENEDATFPNVTYALEMTLKHSLATQMRVLVSKKVMKSVIFNITIFIT